MAVLISYRNEDSPMLSNQLYTALAQRMGVRHFIFGVDNLIELGDLPKNAIESGIQKCDLLLVFIGQNWTSTTWSQNPNDPDCLAITIAQANNKRIIPVFLVDGLQVDRNFLSPSVANILDLMPFICRNQDDVVKLTQALQKLVGASSSDEFALAQAPISTPQPTGYPTSNKPLGFHAPIEQKPMFGVQTAAKVDQFGIEQNAVIGTVIPVMGNPYQDLFFMPYEGTGIRTRIPTGAHVIILARDGIAPWLNVAYISTTGQSLGGWLPMMAVQNVNYMNMPVEVLDLPISQYEYNDIEEVKQVKKHIAGERRKIETKYFLLSIAIFAILGGIWGLLDQNLGSDRDYNYRTEEYEIVYQEAGSRIVSGVLIGGFIGMFIYWIPTFFAPKYKVLSQEIVRLKKIQQSKKGTGTLGLETLAKVGIAAASVAGVVGAGALVMRGRAGEKERQHQQDLAGKGAYGRFDHNKSTTNKR